MIVKSTGDNDGDPFHYPLVSSKYRTSRYGPLAVALTQVLAGPDGYFREGKVREHLDALLSGVPFTGPAAYEIAHWSRQFAVLDDSKYKEIAELAVQMDEPVEGSFYAWLDTAEWNYNPTLVIYGPAEFREVFLDACINLCRERRDREPEFLAALQSKGLV